MSGDNLLILYFRHFATIEARLVRKMISAGVDVNFVTKAGMHPLTMLNWKLGSPAVYKLLLDAGSNFHQHRWRNTYSTSPSALKNYMDEKKSQSNPDVILVILRHDNDVSHLT